MVQRRLSEDEKQNILNIIRKLSGEIDNVQKEMLGLRQMSDALYHREIQVTYAEMYHDCELRIEELQKTLDLMRSLLELI